MGPSNPKDVEAVTPQRTMLRLPHTGTTIYVNSIRLKGSDLVAARRMTKENDPAKDLVFTYALWARALEKQNGTRFVLEDLLEMDSVDLAEVSSVLEKDPRFQRSAEAETNSTPPSPAS